MNLFYLILVLKVCTRRYHEGQFSSSFNGYTKLEGKWIELREVSYPRPTITNIACTHSYVDISSLTKDNHATIHIRREGDRCVHPWALLASLPLSVLQISWWIDFKG